METKEKLEEALQLILNLRVELTHLGHKELELKAAKADIAICEAHDLLNNVALADVRLSLPSDIYMVCDPNDGEIIAAYINEDDCIKDAKDSECYTSKCKLHPKQ